MRAGPEPLGPLAEPCRESSIVTFLKSVSLSLAPVLFGTVIDFLAVQYAQSWGEMDRILRHLLGWGE